MFEESSCNSCNVASFGFKKSRSLVVTLVQRWKSMAVPWEMIDVLVDFHSERT